MDGPVATWLQFAACAVVITIAGSRLSRYADIIGSKTGWSGTWAGIILLSTVTSLPELATGVSAAGFANTPDIAVGDILGSCTFNLLLLVVLDALYREKPLYCAIESTHMLSAAFGISLAALACAFILLGKRLDGLALWHLGISAPLIPIAYVAAMRVIYQHNQRQDENDPDAQDGAQGGNEHGDITLKRAVLMYAMSATVVVAAGAWLPFVAMRLSKLMGWEDAFVGTLFVALATSLPELSVSLTALRLGLPDMAVANLLGSNMFNITVLSVDDLVYRPGPLLSQVASIHALSALAAIIMGAVTIVALVTRPRKRLLGTVTWPSLVLVAVFALNSIAMYFYGESSLRTGRLAASANGKLAP